MENLEEKLIQMTKPQVSQLKHQEMLANAITSAKDKSALSLWWLSIPVYIIAAFIMKTLFMPGTTLASNISEFAAKNKYPSLFIFLAIPVAFIIINLMGIRKLYFLAGSPKAIDFLMIIWYNVLMIIASILVVLIYLL